MDETPDRKVEETAALIRAAAELIDLPADGDVFSVLNECLQDLLPETVSLVGAFDEADECLTVHSILGDAGLLTALSRESGVELHGRALAVSPGLRERLKGEPVIPEAEEILRGMSPDLADAVAASGKGLGAGVAAFVWHGRLMGAALILGGRGLVARRRTAIEAFSTLAAAAFNRTAAALAARQQAERTRTRMGEGITIVDGSLTFLFASSVTGQICGVPHGRLLGRNLVEFLDDASRASLNELIPELPNTRRAGLEVTFIRPDGGRRHVAMTITPRYGDPAVRPNLFLALRDVTEQREAEENTRRLTAAVEQAGEAMLVTDTTGVVLYANPAFLVMSGCARHEIVGRTLAFLRSDRHDDAFYRGMWQTVLDGGVWGGRLTGKRKDGALRKVDATVTPLRDDEGQIVNLVGVMRDVTQVVQLEEQLRQSQKMQAVGTLAGGVAHDFNNLLSVILANAEFIADELPKNGQVRRDLDDVIAAGRKATTLTRQLLAFSRKQVLETKVIDLGTSVRELEKMLRRIIGENIALETVAVPDLPLVKVDPGQIEQVIMNLIINARDAMPRGGRITITLDAVTLGDAFIGEHPEVPPGRYARMTVADDGAGMDDETKKRLFEPFYTTKGIGHGTGLGLATVDGIVAQSGGCITVESVLGKGSTFTVHLPVTTETLQAGAPAIGAALSARPGETVLVIEDDPSVLYIISRILTGLRYRVLKASDGEEATAIVLKEGAGISLVLADVILPGMSGPEVYKECRPHLRGARVLFMSGHSDNTAEVASVLGSGFPFYRKPIEHSSLATKVREVLNGPPPPELPHGP